MASSLEVLPCCVMRDKPTEKTVCPQTKTCYLEQGLGNTKYNGPDSWRYTFSGTASRCKSVSRRTNCAVSAGMGGKFWVEAISEGCASQVRDAWVGSSRSRNIGPDSAPLSWTN